MRLLTSKNALQCLLLVAPLLSLFACDYGDDDWNDDDYSGVGSECGTLVKSAIDVGVGVEADEGVSLIIEYTTGGHWSVRSACDTKSSGSTCTWDVVVQPLSGGTITRYAASGTEYGDELGWYGRGNLHFGAYTANEVKAFSFDATPGATMRFDILLDGQCAGPHVYWQGDGAVHRGAPSNPLDLTPSGE